MRLLLLPCLLLLSPLAQASAACVMAKWQGDTLDYALVAVDGPPEAAIAFAREELYAKGYDRFGAGVDVTHPQAVTDLPSARAIVIKSVYPNQRGRERTSYGCGFSATSFEEASWAAVRDLQAHSWGWKPDAHGYEVVERRRY